MSAQPPDHGMTQEQFEALTSAMVEAIGRMHGGARVSVTDPRLTALNAWILGVVGSGAVAALVWGASSLSQLNVTVSTVVARQGQQDNVLQDHEGRLRVQERKP